MIRLLIVLLFTCVLCSCKGVTVSQEYIHGLEKSYFSLKIKSEQIKHRDSPYNKLALGEKVDFLEKWIKELIIRKEYELKYFRIKGE